jgi:hypothetical protein
MVLLESLGWLMLGLWNTVGIFFIVQRGGGPALGGHGFFVGIAQLFSAYTTLRSYPAYSNVCQQVETLYVQELEQATKGAWKGKTSELLEVAEFKIGSFTSGLKK